MDEPIPDVLIYHGISPDRRNELKRLLHGVEVIDRTATPPAVVSRRQRP